MNLLLIFFAFPIAVIIISFVLQKLLQSPLTVASIIFAIFIVITFAAFDETFLIATFAYTVLSFTTALITRTLYCRNDENNNIRGILNQILERVSSTNTNGEFNYTNNYNDNIEQIFRENDETREECECNRYRRRY